MAEEKTGGTPATKAKNKYNAKAYDQFLVTVPTGQKAEIDREAKKQQKSWINGQMTLADFM